MPDADTNQTPQGDPVAPPANPNPPTNPPPTDPPTTPPGDPTESTDPVNLKKALDAERALRATAERDAKAKAREATEAQAKLKEREDAEKTEAQKLAERAESAEKERDGFAAKLKQQAVDHAVATAARDQGFINPDDASRFLSLDAIEFDEKGAPKGIADLVKTLASERSYLIAQKETPKGPPSTPRANGTGPTSDEERAHDMAFRTHTRSRF